MMAKRAIVLVHGTFAGDAAWLDEESPLSRALKAAFPDAVLHPFRWSGANAHHSRTQAGFELSSDILEIHRDTGATEFWLIGHSHGGNVILYALRDAQAASLVSRIAFLGTPFLEMTRIDTGWLTSVLQDDETAFQDEVQTMDPSIPVFVATISGDEALRHLTAVDFFSAGLWLMGLSALAGAALTVFLAMVLSAMTDFPSPAESALPLWAAGPIMFFAPIVWVLVSRGLRGSSSGFGGESLSIASTLRVAPRALPPWPLAAGSRVHSRTLSPDNLVFRHSTFYDDAEVISELSDWLAAPLDSRNSPDRSVSGKAPARQRVRAEHFPLRPAIFGAFAMALALIPPGRNAQEIEGLLPVDMVPHQLTMGEVADEVLDRFVEANAATPPPPDAASNVRRLAPILEAAVERTERAKGWQLAFDRATGLLTISRPVLAGSRGMNLYPLLPAAINCRRSPFDMSEAEIAECLAGATGDNSDPHNQAGSATVGARPSDPRF